VRIVIDMQGAQSQSKTRGIGRYSLSFALAIARNAREHEIWLALNGAFPESILGIRHKFEGLIPQERIRVFEIPAPVIQVEPANIWRIRAAEKIREHFLHQLKPDVIHVTSLFEGYEDDAVTSVGTFTSGLVSATLYDLIPLIDQQYYLTNETHRDYYFNKVQALKNAHLLLTISESSRKEAIENLQLSQNKIVNVSAAVEEKFHPNTLTFDRIHQLKSKYGVERNIVMYVPGGFDRRKNFEGLIRAYSMVPSAIRVGYQLVIVGNIGAYKLRNLQKLAKQAGLANDELVVTGFIPDEDLIDFYNLVTLFVFPSKHEGFGLTVLEAMSCGVPVIGSNCTSISEVIGFTDALFDPYSPENIAHKLCEGLSDEAFRERLKVHGLDQAKNFTWDKCAMRAISALEQLVQVNITASGKELKTIPELIRSIADLEIDGSHKPSDSDLALVADCIAFNAGHAACKQLLLDISEIVQHDAKSGIQRVVRSLLREFIDNPPSGTDVRPIYFDGTYYRYASGYVATYIGIPTPMIADEIVDFCQDDIYLALDLNTGSAKSVHDMHMDLQCRGVKLYFIVFDILLIQHPEWWPAWTNVIFEAWLQSISKVATGLICISEAVAEEVRVWIKENPPQRLSGPLVTSFHLGADVENSLPSTGLPENAHMLLEMLNGKTCFLMVGTIEPRKAHAQTIGAFELLWAQGLDIYLVIVGKQGWLVEHVIDRLRGHPELNKRLFWLEQISDEFLEKIYAASTCLIAASEGEGFGLPLIEAAQHNKPIIARDIPVLREVAGEHAFYFKGRTPKELADTIILWMELSRNDAHPKSEGMHFLTWHESALQLKARLGLD